MAQHRAASGIRPSTSGLCSGFLPVHRASRLHSPHVTCLVQGDCRHPIRDRLASPRVPIMLFLGQFHVAEFHVSHRMRQDGRCRRSSLAVNEINRPALTDTSVEGDGEWVRPLRSTAGTGPAACSTNRSPPTEGKEWKVWCEGVASGEVNPRPGRGSRKWTGRHRGPVGPFGPAHRG